MITLAPRLPDVAHPRMVAVSLLAHGLLLLAILAFSFSLPKPQKVHDWNVTRVKIMESTPGPPAMEKLSRGPSRMPALTTEDSLTQAELTETTPPRIEEKVEPRIVPAPRGDSIPMKKRKQKPARVETPKPQEKKTAEPVKQKPDSQELLEKKLAAIRDNVANRSASSPDKRLAATAPASGGQSAADGADEADEELKLWLNAAKQEINSRWRMLPDTRRIRKPTIAGVRIANDGRIADARVEESSGDEAFDRSALSAVSQAALLLPPLSPPAREKIVRAGGLALRFTPGGMQ
jgi:colicin import membrane protein